MGIGDNDHMDNKRAVELFSNTQKSSIQALMHSQDDSGENDLYVQCVLHNFYTKNDCLQ